MNRVYKIWYEYLKGDIMDQMTGEKSPDDIERALYNFTKDMAFKLEEDDSIDVVELKLDSNSMIVAIESDLDEEELKQRMEEPLKLGLLFCEEYKKNE